MQDARMQDTGYRMLGVILILPEYFLLLVFRINL